MISLEEARRRVLPACRRLETVTLGLDEALGSVLAEDVTAADPVPPFANSAMDGFALRAADLRGATSGRPARLAIIGTVSAGTVAERVVGAGEAMRIMTGAPVPDGADAIAMVEITRTAGEVVEVSEAVKLGAHIRASGEDLAAGQPVFTTGVCLRPGHLGVLASAGRARVTVWRSPRVGVLSTGDELVEGGVTLRRGQIRDSNRRTLLGLLRRDGFEAVDLGIAPDDEDEIRRRMVEGASHCDAVLTSGGVSMGDFDFVKKVLGELADMAWMQVAIRPAKPFAFGAIDGVPIFGLPGNPVSSMVSYELLARPGLRQMAGFDEGDLIRPSVPAVVDDSSLLRSDDGRTNYIRVVATMSSDGRYHARSAGGQGSNLLWPMAVADALAIVPSGPGVPEGGMVEVLLLNP